jgi:hypothetical protein
MCETSSTTDESKESTVQPPEHARLVRPAVSPRLAIVAGRRRFRTQLSRPLGENGWEVAQTSDLHHALYHVRCFQPDLVAFELGLARAGHDAGLPSVQILAPHALFVTFGEQHPGTCRDELDALGVWCHLDLPPALPVDRLFEEFLGRFERALAGVRTVAPQPDMPEPRVLVAAEPARTGTVGPR